MSGEPTKLKILKSHSLIGHKAPVVCLEYCDRLDGLYSGSEDGSVRLWDLKTGKPVKAILPSLGKDDSINSIAASGDFVFIAYGTHLAQYDIRKPEILLKETVWEMNPNCEEINQVSISQDGSHLAFCDDDNSVKVLLTESHQLVRSMRKHTNACTTVQFRAGTNEVISGGYDCQTLQCDYKKNKLVNKYEQTLTQDDTGNIMNPPYVHSLDVKSDGRFAVIGYGNGSLEAIDLQSRISSNKVTQAHTHAVCQVNFAKFSDMHVLSGGNDTMIKLWNVKWPTESIVQESEGIRNQLNGLKKLVASTQKTATYTTLSKNKQKIEALEQSLDALDWKCHFSLDINIWHKIKINWITTSLSGKIFVGDVSNDISCYNVQL